MKFKENIIRQAEGGRSFKVERVACESHRDEKGPLTAFLTAPPVSSLFPPPPSPFPSCRLSGFLSSRGNFSFWKV